MGDRVALQYQPSHAVIFISLNQMSSSFGPMFSSPKSMHGGEIAAQKSPYT
jgi:hypothetical protein